MPQVQVCEMTCIATLFGCALSLVPSLGAFAQLRSGQPEVASPLARPTAPVIDLSAFKSRYQDAGAPRVLLFWNVAFDDETDTQHQQYDHTDNRNSSSSTSLDKQTAGEAGEANLKEFDGKDAHTVDHVAGVRPINAAKHAALLNSVTAVQLESAFRRTLQRAQVQLLGRDFSLRMTQAEKDRRDVDPKLIESDAIVARAGWLLEVLTIPDASGPLGVGFKVTLTDVKSGSELASFFSVARPVLPPVVGYYAATDHGFEWRQPRQMVTADQVGAALAIEVMRAASQSPNNL
jgi:hypothetical protein